MRTPQVGDIVLAVLASPVNGTDVAPAIVTRVWEPDPQGGWTVNMPALPDGFFTPQVLTSVRLVDAEDVARAWARTGRPTPGRERGGRGAWTR